MAAVYALAGVGATVRCCSAHTGPQRGQKRQSDHEDEAKRINDHYEGENNDIEFRALKKSAGLKEQSEQLGCIAMPRLLMVSGVRVRTKKNSPNRAYRIHSSCNRSGRSGWNSKQQQAPKRCSNRVYASSLCSFISSRAHCSAADRTCPCRRGKG